MSQSGFHLLIRALPAAALVVVGLALLVLLTQ